MLHALGLDELHHQRYISLGDFSYVLFYRKTLQDILVIDSYRIFGVLVRQHNATVSLGKRRSFEVIVIHCASLNKRKFHLISWLVEEHFQVLLWL